VSKAIAALVLLSPFVPMLFQGEEWGATAPFFYFTDHGEEMGRLVSEGRKRDFETFGWASGDIPDPQLLDTFTRSKLNWTERSEAPHTDLLDWHRALIALRHTFPENTPASVEFDESKCWLTMQRGHILVLFNFANRAQKVPLPKGNWALQLSSHHDGTLEPVPAHGTLIATSG
jgi:maltooligosyltrehalose trehalohydrolase